MKEVYFNNYDVMDVTKTLRPLHTMFFFVIFYILGDFNESKRVHMHSLVKLHKTEGLFNQIYHFSLNFHTIFASI